MQRFFLYIIAITILFGSMASVPVKADDADEQRAVAKKFVTAYFLQDIKSIRECLPENEASLFSPYPFADDPNLSNARVHETQAMIEFTAPMRDGKFPRKGGIVFHKSDGAWKVRQVIFYNRIPALFGLPSRSVTADDRAQEDKVERAGKIFLHRWKENDAKGMIALWHNWTVKTPKRIKGLTVTDFNATVSTTAWKDPYVSYTVKVTYHFGPLFYSMRPDGGIMLVKEKGDWKVRASHFVFDF